MEEMYEKRMQLSEEERNNELLPFDEAERIAYLMTLDYGYRIHFKKENMSEKESVLEFYYTVDKVKRGSDKKPTWRIIPALKIGPYFNNYAIYLPTYDRFTDGSRHLFRFNGRYYFFGEFGGNDNFRWFNYDRPYDRYCLRQMMKEIKKLRPDTVYTDRNIFIK